ncbi:radical SAM/SPASM domain-containing protein [Candidatus Pseudothioglobus singularis]|uniref:Fe-S osidoreductase n=1 Tax=Candidatus Pseudothioglobus singularis PS1 TaxID=1125411 RepID=A0A0M4L656_9GAMM|nr:radical SAM protein [Candidatus Pseudothioglobus singularis]ALE02300.1 Fe-S osidoreductase [Candidatus Pseudothioglobus singularis PS1]
MQTAIPIYAEEAALTEIEGKKRQDQSIKRPRVYEKIQNYFGNMADGVISPILRLKINRSLCNFHCLHCCEEPYMSRDLKKKTGTIDPRHQMTIDDYAELSRQADEYGIYRFVLTGGEALLDKNLEELIIALDPMKHLIILDTNGWTFDEEKAKWFAALGGYKVQISLDSFIEEEHDSFRVKPGSYKRALRAVKASKEAGLELLISTCIVKDRVFSKEFDEFCEYCYEEDIPLYVTLAKPVGSARGHDEWVCTKDDVDYLKLLEDKYNIFTHMTPSYGRPGQCITVKGINTINHDGEIVPCPYMDLSIGNVMTMPLSDILDRGMQDKWLGPYRDECIIGENFDFIKFHNDTVTDHLKESPLLPVPYEKGFAIAGLSKDSGKVSNIAFPNVENTTNQLKD